MPRASLRLTVLWALLIEGPLVLGGFAQDLPGPASQPALGWAFAGVVVLLAGLPLLWVALGAGRGDWRHPLREAGLLGAVSLPALTLAWPYAEVSGEAALGALVYLACWLAAVAAATAWGPRLNRVTAVALAAVAVGGLPLLIVVWSDLLGEPPPLVPHLSPTWTAGRLLNGSSLGPPLAALAAGLAGVLLAPRLRLPRAGRVGAAALASGLALAAVFPAHGEQVRARALLGDRVRPDEPYPLIVEDRGVAPGTLLAARSFATRYAAPAGGPVVLSATPLGGGYRLELDRQDAPWSRLHVELPEPVPVKERELLVGLFGSGARGLAERLGLKGGGVLVEPESLRALAVAGEALDVLVAGAGAAGDPIHAAYLRAWVACGGVLVADAPGDRDRVLGQVGVFWRPGVAWAQVHALGAGFVVAPQAAPALSARAELAPEPGLSGLLSLRLRERARRRALQQVLLEAPAPRPSSETGRRLAFAALAAGLVVLLLGRLAPRVEPATATGAGVALGVALAVLLRLALAPPSPVVVDTIQILELPAEGRVARRLEVVRASSPRRVQAELRLADRDGAGPPRPLFVSQVTAVRARVLIVDEPAGPRLEFTAGPTPRAFLRHDAVPLPGAFSADGGATGLGVDGWVVVDDSGVREPGQPIQPLARWRVGGADAVERRWRALAAAALTGFDLREGSVTLARITSPGGRVGAGLGEERRLPGLLIAPARPTQAD